MFVREQVDDNLFIRRMRVGRMRQLAIAVLSLVAAAVGTCAASPAMIGGFAFYAVMALLILNAILALLQCGRVLRPIEALLRRMQDVSRRVDANDFNVEHLYNQANDEFACLAAGMDVLIEKLSEKARHAEALSLRHIAVVQATPFTFLVVSKAGKVLSVIKDHYDIVPFLKLAVGSTPTEEVCGRENLAAYLKAVSDAFANKELRWFDMPFPESAGHPAHVFRATVSPLNDISALVVMGDMPAIDRTVANMSQGDVRTSRTQKHAALKRLAASVAHDGRNVFAALGNLVALNRQSTDPNVRAQTEIAVDAIARGTNLMTELMQYAGETHYRMQVVQASEMCEKIFANSTLRALVPPNVRLVANISTEPMPPIDVDPDQAWKVSFNLVKNSIEAIGAASGCVWLSARPVEMTPESAKGFRCAGPMPTGKGILMTESDDGPGVNPDIFDKLFDPYASSKGRGRGLGLATVFSIVEAHNGAIRVKSRPGMGASFEIFLPASRHSAEELEIIRQVAPGGEILLVDDDSAILRTTRLLLESVKVAAHPAANVADAVRKMRALRERIRAVLVDANLEDSSRFMKVVRDEYPDTVIILSSGAPEESFGGLRAAKLYDRFLSKPYSIADITAALGLAEA